MQLAELAALLYLSSYTHARQLWKRRQPSSSADPGSSANPELQQFTLLWEAVESLVAPAAETSENVSNENGEATAMAQLGACVASGQQPLATYADEVLKKWRSEKMIMMEECYDTIKMQDCAALLGYTDDAGREEMANTLRGRGWTVAGECWIPGDADEDEDEEEEKKEEEEDAGGMGAADRIKELADIVGFMEMSKLNL